MTFKEFTNQILHREKHNNPHKITGSLGVYDCYKYLRKNKWFDIPRAITEKEFYSIIRTINNMLQEDLCKGKSIVFPYKLGTLELLKKATKVDFVNNKIKTDKKVNWKETLKLWHEDEECRYNKILVRYTNDFNIKIHYSKNKAVFSNKQFYYFKPNKKLNIRIKKLFNDGEIDAMELNYGME